MLVVAALLLSSKIALPDIAFSARFYKPGKQKSYYHLYLCNFDGKNKQRFGSNTKSQLSPIWLDRSNLVYAEVDGTPAVESGLGKQKSFQANIKLFNLSSRKSKTLLTTSTVDGWTSYGNKPNTIVIDGAVYTISKSGVSKQKYEVKDNWKPFGNFDIESEKWTATIPEAKGSPEWKIALELPKHDFRNNEEGANFTGSRVMVSSKNLKTSFKLKGETIESVKPIDQTRLIVTTTLFLRRVNNNHFVYELDCKKGTSKLIVSNIGNVDLSSDKGYWIGYQPETKPLGYVPGSGQVWINSLYCGDLKSGKRWTIADGLVHLSNYATRPQK